MRTRNDSHQNTLKCQKLKGNLKSHKRKRTWYIQRNLHKTISRLVSRNFAGQREWHDIFKVLDKRKSPRILYVAELSFRIKVR